MPEVTNGCSTQTHLTSNQLQQPSNTNTNEQRWAKSNLDENDNSPRSSMKFKSAGRSAHRV
eukprot:7919559-Alexandrium_andersonii.AAC.1